MECQFVCMMLDQKDLDVMINLLKNLLRKMKVHQKNRFILRRKVYE